MVGMCQEQVFIGSIELRVYSGNGERYQLDLLRAGQ